MKHRSQVLSKRQTKLKAKPPKLDLEEFNILTDALFETYKENNAACARMLGISTRTWKKWETDPPTWPYWNLILRHILKISISHLDGHRGTSKVHRDRIINALSRLKHDDPLISDIEERTYDVAASTAHLRQLLIRKGMYKDEIMTTANLGGFSRQMIESASRVLEVVKTQKGFGEHKRSYWRLPNEDDD